MSLRKSVSVALAILCCSAGCQISQAAAGVGQGSAPASNDPWAGWNDTPLFNQPLFQDPLFPTDNIKKRMNSDLQSMTQPASTSSGNGSANSGFGTSSAINATIDAKINSQQVDDEMRRQMRSVAHWLYLYCLRNGSRFPGPAGQMDIMWAAQAQLQELVPNNPYAYGNTEALNWGIPAYYNANGSPQTGSPVWDDQYQNGLQANQNGRVQLQFDYGLNPTMADQYANNPPSTWTAAPGTITASGNNQGFFIVWGADKNGKPIKNPANGKTFVISVSTSGTVNDRIAPNQT